MYFDANIEMSKQLFITQSSVCGERTIDAPKIV